MKKDQKAGKDVGNVIILGNETTDQIAIADMTELISHDVQQQIDRGIVGQEITKAMRDITTDRALVKDELERSIHQQDAIFNLQRTRSRHVRPSQRSRRAKRSINECGRR